MASSTRELRQTFDELVARAERAATGAEFEALEGVGAEIEALLHQLVAHPEARRDKVLWCHIRSELLRYQGTCAYSLRLLENAFSHAGAQQREGYSREGQPAEAGSQAVLSRQYG